MGYFADLDLRMRQAHPCWRCGGSGMILHHISWRKHDGDAPAVDERHDRPCPICRGIGYDPAYALPDHDNDDEEG